MLKQSVKCIILSIAMLGIAPMASFASTLHWNTTKAAALAELQSSGKKRLFLIIGNASCYNCYNTRVYYAETATVKPILEEHYVLWYHDEWSYPNTWTAPFYSQMRPPASSALPHSWVIDASDTDNLIALDVAGGTLYPGGIFENLITPWIPTTPDFSEWIGDFGLPAGEQGETNCPAGDSIPNLLKYACGLVPTHYCATADLMPCTVSNGVFAIQYYKSKDTVGVQLDPVWTSSLTNGTWSTGGLSVQQLADEGGREKWSASLPSDGQGFIRLKAE
ncbi:hypothetical protein PDESU_03978 [Pontiella desulfatans]|uniref:Uncharacterized protein n=1 Tax=Pontiella desulfatans TaxID=2750659 RepID=A0A6C2U651_PONDE|nr:hypothetical protein [Pontiella desulfatans]VGO15395.1 hypothetical protein PDESU_03978 [Pontiella desulfatans]